MRTTSLLLSLALVPSLLAQDPQEAEEGAVCEPAPTAPLPASELTGASSLDVARAVQGRFAEISRAVWPSIVTVRAYTKVDPQASAVEASTGWAVPVDTDYPGFREHSALTGWVVGADGEFLTCNHGLLKPDGSLPDLVDVETHDFQRIVVECVGTEPTVNLAILQAMVWPNSHSRRLPALEWGDSEALHPGHWVLGFGDPSGPKRFMQVGTFVSQPSRDCYQDLLSAFYMQVGLVAHPESYGGPLIDLDGKVVGIIAPEQTKPGTWSASGRTGVEFALPSKIVTGLHEAIREVRSFKSPWLGFAVMSRPEIAKVRGIEAYRSMAKPRNGILIENVWDGGPANACGIEPGDWLVTFDKTRIFTPVDFQKQLYLSGIGTKVRVEVFRDGETSWKEMSIEERPAEARPR